MVTSWFSHLCEKCNLSVSVGVTNLRVCEAKLINQFRRINLVKGDCIETVPAFLEENPHVVCALLVLHISLYEPEFTALKEIWPRMPKGAVVLLASLGHYDSPSPTHVVEEVIGISNASIRRFPFATKHSYIVKE